MAAEVATEEEEEEEEEEDDDMVAWASEVVANGAASEVEDCSNVTEYVRLSCARMTEAGDSRPAAWTNPNGDGEVCDTGRANIPLGRRAAAVKA